MTQVQVDCFLSAAKNGSFAAAAKELYFSVQVVSQHIQNLEAELSVKLFVRNRDGVSITEEGKAFRDFAMKWIGLYNRTIQSIRDTYDNMAMSFHIGLSEFVDPLGPISGALDSFCREHTATNVSGMYLNNRDVVAKVQAGTLDVALMTNTQIISGGDIEADSFAREDLRLYISCRPDLEQGLQIGDSRLVQVCQELPQITVPYGPWTDSEWTEVSRRMSASLGLTFRDHVAMPNFRSVVACAGRIPCTMVSDARFGLLRDMAELQSIPLNMESSLCCVWNKRNENPLLPQFVAHMKKYFGEFN